MNINKAFYIFATLTLLSLIADRILFVLFPYYLIEKNLSAIEIGLIFSIASFVLVLSRYFIGKLSDLFGRKKIMSIGLFFQSFATLLFPFASKLYEFATIKSLKEFASSLEGSVEDAIKADIFRKKIRAKFLGRLESLVPFGRMIATIIGFFTVSISIACGFYVAAFVLFIGFLVFTLLFKETKKIKLQNKKLKIKPQKYSKNFIIIVFAGFISSLIYGIAYFPAFFILSEKVLGISASFLYVLLFIDYFVSSIVVYPSGKYIDRFGRLKTVCLGFFGFGIFILLYAFARNWFEFLFVIIGASVSYYLWRVAFKTSLYDFTLKKTRGEQIGFYKTFTGIGDMIGPFTGGVIIEVINLKSAFIVAGLLGIFTALLLTRFLRKSKKLELI